MVKPTIIKGDDVMADLYQLMAALRLLRDDVPRLLADSVWAPILEAISEIEAGFEQVVVKYGMMAPEGVELKVRVASNHGALHASAYRAGDAGPAAVLLACIGGT